MIEIPGSEELNIEIAKCFFGYSDENLNNSDIYIPNYSGDRNLSASVVEKIVIGPDEVREKFLKSLDNYLDRAELEDLDKRILSATPEVICRIALTSIQ